MHFIFGDTPTVTEDKKTMDIEDDGMENMMDMAIRVRQTTNNYFL